MRYRFLRPLHNADQGGGTGGTSTQTSTTTPAGDAPNVNGLMQRHNNDAMQVIATLLSENHGYRDRIRTLTGQVPAQGAMVLTPEQATAWAAYQQLGTIEQLQSGAKDRETAQSELASLRRAALLGQVQEASGYKASVLAQLPGADKLDFAIRDAQQDGKPVKTVVVKDGTTETSLADYAKAQWADFLPALQVTPPAPIGTTFVPQHSGGGTAPTTFDDYAKRFQAQRDEVANPLAPKAAANPLAR